MDLEATVEDIKKLRIQGATNVAKAGVKAVEKLSSKGADEKKLRKSVEKLKKARPTEPGLFNALEYVLSSKDFKGALNHFEESQEIISRKGAEIISDAEEVYTHCHSSTVVNIIERAYKKKKFAINNTETRPVFQGRKTARELSDRGMQVDHFVDSAARIALDQSDYMLIGADAVNSKGDVFNKIGSRLIAESAENLGVPVYVCTDSWKYHDETERGEPVKIEERESSEVWEDSPEGVRVRNPAFERVPSDLITGIVTEIGVVKPGKISEKVKEAYPEIFFDRN